jgi:cytidylate kinase
MKTVAPLKHWPSTAGRTVAVLSRSPEQLAIDYGLDFEEGLDDLDRYLVAAVEDPGIGQFWLFKHRQAPMAGTEVIVDAAVSTSAGVAAARRQLGIEASDFAWTSPDETDQQFAAVRGPIAIDGPAASGKTTVGEAVARAIGFAFLDTGLMYRAFTYAALREGIPPSDAGACGALADILDLRAQPGPPTRILISGDDVTAHLRDPEVELNVSLYSAIPEVRRAMVEQQRSIARDSRFILAGRDIGTVVLPNAPVKLFLTASEEARTRRRGIQEGSNGTQAARSDIATRDKIDSARVTSPLRPAADAIIIDTTDLTLDEVVARALDQVQCGKS